MDEKTIRMDSTNDPSIIQRIPYQANQNNQFPQPQIGDPLADYKLPDSLIKTTDKAVVNQQQTNAVTPNIYQPIQSPEPMQVAFAQPAINIQADLSWQQEEPFDPPTYDSLTIITNNIVLIASLRIGIEAITLINLNKSSQFIELFLRLVDNVLYLGFIILLIVWVHRAYLNLAAFFTADLKATPEMAALCFLIPIINIYTPYQRLQEIWKASDPSDSFRRIDPYSWQKKPASQLINFWWGIYIIYNISQTVVLALLTHHIKPAGISLLFGLALNILTIIMVNRITNLQDEKISYLS